MEVYKIVLSAISGLIFVVLLRQTRNEYALLTSCLISLMLMVTAVGILSPAFDYIHSLENTLSTGSFIGIMLKCTGIGLLCAFGSELCRDCGENSIGARIELIGKCTMIAYSIPLLKTVLDYATSFIS